MDDDRVILRLRTEPTVAIMLTLADDYAPAFAQQREGHLAVGSFALDGGRGMAVRHLVKRETSNVQLV